MTNTIAITLLVLFAVLAFFLARMLLSSLADFAKKLPKWVFLLAFLAIVAVMAYLIVFLLHAYRGGESGNTAEDVPEQAESAAPDAAAPEDDGRVVLRGDQIWIHDRPTDREGVEQYLDGFAASGKTLVIVDDYSLYALHHTITELCRERGIDYIEKDETFDGA